MDDYWGPGKKLIADVKFIEGLVQIDKENLPAKASKQIQERVISDESFDPEKLKAVSPVAEGYINFKLFEGSFSKICCSFVQVGDRIIQLRRGCQNGSTKTTGFS
jgi:dynein heavy chain, axonemal